MTAMRVVPVLRGLPRHRRQQRRPPGAAKQCGSFLRSEQNRCLGSSSSSTTTSSSSQRDPFRVLGIPRGSSYQTVKETFLKLALEHHPDRQNNNNNNNQSNNSNDMQQQQQKKISTEEFIRIRQAFEVLKEGRDGLAEATEEPQWTEEQLRAFMEEQTSEFLSFRMDHDTRQQVIDTVENLSPGGLDRGGTWLMARMLAEREQGLEVEGSDGEPPPRQLSARAQSSIRRRKKR